MEKGLVRNHLFLRTVLIAALLVLCLSIAAISAIAAEPEAGTDDYLVGAGDHMEFEAEDGYQAIAAISAEIDDEDISYEEDTAAEEGDANVNLNPVTGR